MNSHTVKIIDRTGGTAYADPGAVIIHDINGEDPSIIAHNHQIAETLEPLAYHHPEENYREFHTDIQDAWNQERPWAQPYAEALGARIEHLDKFIGRAFKGTRRRTT